MKNLFIIFLLLTACKCHCIIYSDSNIETIAVELFIELGATLLPHLNQNIEEDDQYQSDYDFVKTEISNINSISSIRPESITDFFNLAQAYEIRLPVKFRFLRQGTSDTDYNYDLFE